jgi:Ca2+-binding RTX toxin-like protein
VGDIITYDGNEQEGRRNRMKKEYEGRAGRLERQGGTGMMSRSEAWAIQHPSRRQRAMRKATTIAATMALAVALSAGAASADLKRGTNVGEVLNGTPRADTIYALGGADVVRGYAERDVLYGGKEAGFGDKIEGGTFADRILGQDGDDALYGERGDDEVRGGYRDDLVSGGSGNDTLDGGPGSDEINARDGEKDTIVIRSGEGDVVYYDKGLDVLVAPASPLGTADLSAAEANEKAELLAKRPPQGLFEPSGRVLVEHKGEELMVPEKGLEAHLGHGDEILDPTGRAAQEERD